MAVQIRFKDVSNRHFEAEIVTFPALVSLPKENLGGLAKLFTGLFFSILAYILYNAGMRDSGLANPMTIIGLIFAFVGAFNVARWLGGFKAPTEMVFHENFVEVKETGLLQSKNWQASYEEFSGVRMRPQKVKLKRAAHTDPYQIIELVHPDKSKTLPLYAARSKNPPHDHLAHYEEILGVPVIDYN